MKYEHLKVFLILYANEMCRPDCCDYVAGTNEAQALATFDEYNDDSVAIIEAFDYGDFIAFKDEFVDVTVLMPSGNYA